MAIAQDELYTLIIGLRALAKQAPPAPWLPGRSTGYGNPNVSAADGPLFSTGNGKRSRASALAAARFTAALDPEMVLTLCDAIEQLLAERQALIDGIDRLSAAVGLDA